uniref:Uncharacterized protein n=1 Tax=Globodera rostochiensis TaxID=31243 RepID=A0A914I2B4_GLORO
MQMSNSYKEHAELKLLSEQYNNNSWCRRAKPRRQCRHGKFFRPTCSGIDRSESKKFIKNDLFTSRCC